MKKRDNVIAGSGNSLGVLTLVMILVFSVQVTAQSSEIITAENLVPTLSNPSQVMHYAPEEVEEENREALNSIISVNFDRVPMKEALHKIADLGGLKLAYSRNLEEDVWDEPVSLQLNRATVLGALYAVLDDTDLRLTLSSNSDTGQIVVKRESVHEITSEESASLYALQESIQGRVVEASTNEPLPGVNIVYEGTNIGTVTDATGRYQLDIPSLEGSLVISYIGYESQTVPIQGRTTIDIALQSEVLHGEEMVVTAFGLEREERSLTYATQDISVNQLTEARELNVINSLEGKVAGLSISQSGGGVGAPSRVVLRGNRSISGDNQPLYVIDGVPVLGNPENLMSDNIESINVLKGANAAALYGSDAQDGIIVITTKKGYDQGVKVSMNNTFMLNDAYSGIPFQNEYGQGTNGVYQESGMYSWGPRMEGQSVAHWTQDPSRAGETYAFEPQPNNVKDLFRTGFTLSNTLQTSVGNETTQGIISVSSEEGRGILPNNNLDRKNVFLRLTGTVSDRFSWDAKLDYTRQEIDNPTRQSDNNFNPFQQIYMIPRNIRTQDVKDFEYAGSNGVNQQDFWCPGCVSTAENPYWVLNRNVNSEELDRVTGMISLAYDFTDALSLMVRGSYDSNKGFYEQKDYNGTFIRAEQGRYTVETSHSYEFNGDFLLSYNRNIDTDWYLDVNLGGNLKRRLLDKNTHSDTGDALLIPNLFAISNTNLPETNYDPGLSSRIESFYSFGTLGWKDAIYLDLGARNDWSSTLPANSRSYFYPSVGVTAVLSDLIPAFPELFSLAKLRASWAKVGSSPPPYLLDRTANFSAGGSNGFLSLDEVLPNKDLKPEETTSFESGFDIRLLEGRLGLDFTYFKTNTINQLFTIALPVGSGADSFFTNGGDIESEGIEVMLTTTPVRSRRLTWNVDLNFTHYKNIVEEISDERPKVVIQGQGNSYFSDYVIQQGLEFGEMFTPGFMRDDNGNVIVGSNGLPQINNQRDFSIGTYTPDWKAGFLSTLSYRNFDLTFVVDHRQGGVVGSFTRANLVFAGLTDETLEGRDGGLIFGDNFFSEYSAVKEDGSPNDIAIDAESFWRTVGNPSVPVGEVFAEEATNTRLRELTIGYNLPSSLVSRFNLNGVKVSLVGRNLFFIYRATPGLDPDILVGTGTSSEGFSSFPPPTTRSFGMNLKVEF